MEEINVLYVDDELVNLNSFKANFRRNYNIYTAQSAQKSLEILETEPIHIVISDQRMPGTSGVELFKLVKEQYPDPVRVLLTGYSDINILAEAINEGHIFRYLTKPWSHLELDTCIKNAFDFYNAKTSLKQKVNELQKLNDDLNRFIYSISHELRAPIASALGAINLAKLEGMFEEGSDFAEYGQMIEDCIHKLDHSLSSMLQYYKNSRYKIDLNEIQFLPTIEKLITLFKTAHGVGYEIDFKINVAQPGAFVGDAFRIEIILGNLISNAIKYQNPDEKNKLIEITASITDEEAHIQVRDNGLGISPEEKDAIFDQFYRSGYHQGAGLGLFIAKEALSKLNGSIFLESEPKKGSIFTIQFPNQLNKQQTPI